MSAAFEYVFPAIRGIQAGREYYVSMCPLKLIPKLFLFDEDELELLPELRAQRTLNYRRVPAMAKYIVDNKDDYVFSAITASINGEFEFDPIQEAGEKSRSGMLRINMDSSFIINDGQHRRAAIEEALKLEPSLADETISVVFYIDRGLKRCQQMFSDLNLNQVKANKSQGILYDQRDDFAFVARYLARECKTFSGLVEMEKNSLSPRSSKLFTLSAIYQATSELLAHYEDIRAPKILHLARDYWEIVGDNIKQWGDVKDGLIKAGEIRIEYIHAYAVTLHALGLVGRTAITESPQGWKEQISHLSNINWRRDNTKEWEGRCMSAGRMAKTSTAISLTSNLLKVHLNLPLNSEEQKLENAFNCDDKKNEQ